MGWPHPEHDPKTNETHSKLMTPSHRGIQGTLSAISRATNGLEEIGRTPRLWTTLGEAHNVSCAENRDLVQIWLEGKFCLFSLQILQVSEGGTVREFDGGWATVAWRSPHRRRPAQPVFRRSTTFRLWSMVIRRCKRRLLFGCVVPVSQGAQVAKGSPAL